MHYFLLHCAIQDWYKRQGTLAYRFSAAMLMATLAVNNCVFLILLLEKLQYIGSNSLGGSTIFLWAGTILAAHLYLFRSGGKINHAMEIYENFDPVQRTRRGQAALAYVGLTLVVIVLAMVM